MELEVQLESQIDRKDPLGERRTASGLFISRLFQIWRLWPKHSGIRGPIGSQLEQ